MRLYIAASGARILVILLAPFPGLATAQASMSSALSTNSDTAVKATTVSSAASAANTWIVSVGKADHAFKPDTIQASPGDTVQFQFFPANHSVVRAAYLYPCVPYELTTPGARGFFSGFRAVDTILENPPTWNLRINDTDPIFFYCSAVGSCLGYQMVGVINPNANVSLAAQQSAAKEATYMLQPGDSFPSEGGNLTGSNMPAKSVNPLPAKAIAGIVAGAIVILLLGAVLAYFIGRVRKVKERRMRAAQVTTKMHRPLTAGRKASLPFTAADPYSTGMVYIPIKATDFAEYNHRLSGTKVQESEIKPLQTEGGETQVDPRTSGNESLKHNSEGPRQMPARTSSASN